MLSPTFKVSFAQLSAMGPFEAWNAIPILGQMQILWTIAGLEHASECLDPDGHYTKGGTPGNLKFLKNFWDLPGFLKKATPEEKKQYREAELKHGRIAMIGIMSICSPITFPEACQPLSTRLFLSGPASPFLLAPFSSGIFIAFFLLLVEKKISVRACCLASHASIF
jgi:hypothetical protein